MLLDMILKTIPRSWKAFAALMVMFAGFGLMLNGLQALVMPEGSMPTNSKPIYFVFGLIIALPAVVAFYYFQSIAGAKKSPHELETLDAYYRSKAPAGARHHTTATPVFSSHDVTPDKDKKSGEQSDINRS